MPSVTVSAIEVVRVMPSAVPVTLSVYVPVGVTVPVFEVFTVRVAELPLVAFNMAALRAAGLTAGETNVVVQDVISASGQFQARDTVMPEIVP